MGELVKLFVSYSRPDSKFVDALRKHLSGLSEWENRAQIWWDGAIDPGAPWSDEISAALRDSDIVVFLISPDLLASQFVRTVELETTLRRLEARSCEIIPIRIRDVDVTGTPFATFQWIPRGAPVGSPRNDRAWVEVSKALRKAVDKQERRRAPQPVAVPRAFTGTGLASSEPARMPDRYDVDSPPSSDSAKILEFRRRENSGGVLFHDGENSPERTDPVITALASANLTCSDEWSVDNLRLSKLRQQVQQSLLSSEAVSSRWADCAKDLIRQIDILSADLPRKQRTAASNRALALRDILLAIGASSRL